MVGQRIRYYRKTKGLTQEELAQGICSVSYLSKIEKGDAKSSEEVINLLCERLGISPEEVDNNEILEMLNEWNMMMVHRKFKDADSFFPVLNGKMKLVFEPELLVKFELFKARYLLINDKIPEAEEILAKVNTYHLELSKVNQFYYYSFNAFYYIFIKDYKSALRDIKKAEDLYSFIDLTVTEIGYLFYLIAVTYSNLYRISTVNQYAYKAIEIFDKEYNYSRSADCQILLGISSRRVRNYEQAIYHFNQALKYSKPFKDDYTTGVIYHNLGFVFSCQKEHKKAIEYLLKGLDYKGSDSENVINTYYLLSKEYYNIKDYKNSKKYLDQGIGLIKQKDEYYFHFKMLDYILTDKDIKDIEEFLSKDVIPYFEKQNIWEYLSSYSERLADIYFDQSLYKRASIYYRKANNSRKKIF
ncbi:tetratricopeptide repeat protein [Fictibacillus nanhaiensis]|uniref:Tetratricopeptide repeat protein n=1 Tax=Fictibacillus nanhaiensis TaxID=742169 RepID=A0ABS2ZJH3_9BACL|nr:tetratricopeptide repeat protein [Fictibacillus nanhaiensis]